MADYHFDGTTTFVPGESNDRASTAGVKAEAEAAAEHGETGGVQHPGPPPTVPGHAGHAPPHRAK